MTLFRVMALCLATVLVGEALMVELEKGIHLGDPWGPLVFAMLFIALGFAVRRKASIWISLVGALVAAIAYVTIGYWVAGFVGSGMTKWRWLGSPPVLIIATLYFFTLTAIGVVAASIKIPRGNR